MTITTLRTAGWTAINNAPKGCTGFWTITSPAGAVYEVDYNPEVKEWVVDAITSRDGWTCDTFTQALQSLTV